MLEIKCPLTREIKLEGEIYGEICPEYYFAQVQVQLEVCDLDECDFLQCKIEEYSGRNEFNHDTALDCLYKSAEYGMEKGCIIQLLPKDKIMEFCLYSAKYIYPPKINMSPKDYDDWISDTINNLWKTHKEYVFDKTIYWKLTRMNNVTIIRDKKWFNQNCPMIKETWDFITFYRQHTDKLDGFCKYLEQCKNRRNINELMMQYAYNDYYNIEQPSIFVKPIVNKEQGQGQGQIGGDFVSSSDEETNPVHVPIKVKSVQAKKGKSTKNNKNNNVKIDKCMILTDSDE
jgi:hypothetical protein